MGCCTVVALAITAQWLLLTKHSVNRQLSLEFDFPVFLNESIRRYHPMYVYPPFFAWIITPLTKLRVKNAVRLWHYMNAPLIGFVVWYSLANAPLWFVAVALPFFVWQCYLQAEIGNVNVLVTSLMLWGVYGSTFASEAIYLAGAIKILPLVCLPFVVENRPLIGLLILFLSYVVPKLFGYYWHVGDSVQLLKARDDWKPFPRKAHLLYLSVLFPYLTRITQ